MRHDTETKWIASLKDRVCMDERGDMAVGQSALGIT